MPTPLLLLFLCGSWCHAIRPIEHTSLSPSLSLRGGDNSSRISSNAKRTTAKRIRKHNATRPKLKKVKKKKKTFNQTNATLPRPANISTTKPTTTENLPPPPPAVAVIQPDEIPPPTPPPPPAQTPPPPQPLARTPPPLTSAATTTTPPPQVVEQPPALMTPEDAAGRAAAAAVASAEVTQQPQPTRSSRRVRNRLIRSIVATAIASGIAATNRASPGVSAASIGLTMGTATASLFHSIVLFAALRKDAKTSS